MSYRWKLFLFLLFLATLVVWLSVFSVSSNNLKIVTCDVGQGDATLVVYKGFEILIDGGPDGSVINCLSEYMPFWDRTLEVVILTHPQKDHFMGLIDVFEKYKVEKFLANSLNAVTPEYGVLKSLVLDEGSVVINPTAGMSIRSHLIQLDILHPTYEFLIENSYSLGSSSRNASENIFNTINSCHSGNVGVCHSEGVLTTEESQQYANLSGVLGAYTTTLDPNEFSVVALLKFGGFKFLFTGDASSQILDSLATTLREKGQESVNYIKMPHHGSKNSISEKMYNLIANSRMDNCHSELGSESPSQYTIFNIQYTNCLPPLAVISVGKNSYGHPSKETLDALMSYRLRVIRTDEVGDIVIETDGKGMWMGK